MIEPTQDFNDIEAGLAIRGFVGINLIDNKGHCHLDERHYVLRTDGLIIWTTYPSELGELAKHPKFQDYWEEIWGMEEFTFRKLDEAMKTADELNHAITKLKT